jgi:hypothetical protein
VAYIELAMLLRERRERIDTRRLISLALEREAPPVRKRDMDTICRPEESGLFGDDNPMRNPSVPPARVLTVVSDCAAAERQH